MITIYKNGPYRVIPLIAAYAVVGEKGETLQRFTPGEIEEAIRTVDEMAETPRLAA